MSPHRLTIDQIKYLAIEGGGGKGFAFVGAIQALEEKGLLKTVSGGGKPPVWAPSYFSGIDPTQRLDSDIGISGASAGAITALLISCGYSAADILNIMTKFKFDKFFEPPMPRYVPRIQTDPTSDDPYGRQRKDADPLQLLKNVLELMPALILPLLRGGDFDSKMQKFIYDLTERSKLPQQVVFSSILSLPLNIIISLFAFVTNILGKIPKPLEMVITQGNREAYLAFLGEDMGLFPGYEARKFLAEVIAYKLPLLNGKPRYNATFEELYHTFQVKLAITGTNLETGKSGIFSVDTTPRFPVADAVRISMSLPLAYKPVVIREDERHKMSGSDYLPDWVNGVWIDGGYLNNIPLHVFDLEEGANPKTLGLRLEIENLPEHIESIAGFLLKWPIQFGFFGAGEAHVTESHRNLSSTIILDTTGLDLLNFSPDPDKRDEAIARAKKTTLEYFGE